MTFNDTANYILVTLKYEQVPFSLLIREILSHGNRLNSDSPLEKWILSKEGWINCRHGVRK